MSFIPRQYIAGTIGMNMSVECNMLIMLHLCQTIFSEKSTNALALLDCYHG